MASTKTARVLESGLTLTAGAGDDTGAALDLTDSYGGELHLKITNGGTGPTVAGQIQIQTSADNSEWYDYAGPMVATTGNSEITSWNVDIPMGVMYLRTVQGSNTGQNVTCDIDFGEVEAVS
jgi:hypothetical protein